MKKGLNKTPKPKGDYPMKKTVTKYQIVTADSWRVIAKGFNSWNTAYEHMLMIDFGQFENDGGLIVRPYTA